MRRLTVAVLGVALVLALPAGPAAARSDPPLPFAGAAVSKACTDARAAYKAAKSELNKANKAVRNAVGARAWARAKRKVRIAKRKRARAKAAYHKACQAPVNQYPQFPSPLQHEFTTSYEYDANGRMVGATTTVTVTSAPTDADGDPLTMTWTSSNGTIDGTGLMATWHRVMEGGEPAAGSAKLTVSDGRGGTATFELTLPRGT